MTDNNFMPDDLADRLDAVLPPNQDTLPIADDDVLVNLAVQLARAPRPEMSPETMARIQAQVMQAHRRQHPLQRPVLRLPTTPLMRWAAVFVIAVFFFGSAMITAAASSLPGELLYSVKLGIEQIEVIAAPSPIALSVVHLNHAERRLSEAQILLERGQFESTLLIAGWESLARSAEKAEEAPSADIPFDLQARAAQVNVALNAVLLDAEQSGIVSADEIRNIRVNVVVADDNTPTKIPTLEPSASPTSVPTETSGSTLVAVPTSTPLEEIVVNIPATDDEPEELSDTSTPTVEPSASPTTLPKATAESSVLEMATSIPVETSTYVPTATWTTSPAPDAALTEVATPYIATVFATRGVNVRRGPGINFDIITIVQPGSRVEVIGQNDDESWLYIRLEDHRLGWIAAYLLRSGIVFNTAGGQSSVSDQTNTGDFGCEHPGNYCNAPGYNNDNGGSGDSGQGPGNGNANGNANGGGPPSGGGGGRPDNQGENEGDPPDNPGGSSGQGNPPGK